MALSSINIILKLNTKQFNSKINKVSRQLKKTSKQWKQAGQTLSRSLTLPILAAGAASLKLAADFEVAGRKFAGAFEGAEIKAKAAVDELNKSFGVAKTQATALLAFTGDLLKGFGATSDEAIELSSEVQKLAAALAAYNGVPVKRTSEAITKALLGERESLKLLGVVIREADVKQQMLLDGTSELTGQAKLLATAQATLKLATQQSSDAVDKFAENTDTAAFKAQALIGDISDLGVELGTILLPAFKKIADKIKIAVQWISDLSKETKESIVSWAKWIAVIGPVVFIIGKVIGGVASLITWIPKLASAIIFLKRAFTALNLVIARNPIGFFVTVITTALAALFLFRKRTDSATESQKKLGDAVKEVNAEIGRQIFNELLFKKSNDGINEFTRSLDNLGENLKSFTKEQLESLRLFLDEKIPEATRAAANETNELDKAILELNLKEYEDALVAVKLELDKTTKSTQTQTRATKENIKAIQQQQTTLKGNITWWEEEKQAIEKARKEAKKATMAFRGLKGEIGGLSDIDKQFGDLPKWLSNIVSTLNDKFGSALGNLIASTIDGINKIGEIFSQVFANQEAKLDIRTAKEKKAIEDSQMSEEAKAAALDKLDEETAEKRAKIRRKQAIADKAMALFRATIDGANAVINALITGPIFAAVIAGLVAAQIAVIAAAPLPALAEGGLAFGPTTAIVGDNPNARTDPEVIAPLSKLQNFGGDSGGTLYTEISGDMIRIILDRNDHERTRING